MDYEEKYKTALERAKAMIKVVANQDEAICFANTIFPELAESENEDERIRKAISQCVEDMRGQFEKLYSVHHKDAIAWLEKQGIKPQGKSALEAIHEQKVDNANKVERKFKVGDYIVNDYCKGKVIELTTDAYLLDTEQGIPFSCEHNAHLWSIQDAKDGDVLVFDNNVCTMGTIICKSPTSYDTKSYCRLIDEHFIGKEENGWDSMLLVPATKEQKDFLFKRMEEEGYKWDDEHKELKKIEL